ncbi:MULTISPECIES: polyketide synthase [Paenibacillus]|jgi:polyketide biosynthesis enoyl-CoA hydratase PksI|uniref:Polyketide biosynthesis enoyl-CoA hydratase, pksI-like protein n=1 Tax=Paenibacillus polymyxa TaxID=1406 RepID=A0A0F6EP08_PAEPO|nr:MULTISPECIES: polyketide synthase [Paenibacillus]MDP9674616.1 polyketide biosynthesis enoyl-CoA hydratase PksI [Paenibacillus jamilae]AHM66824.1 polyketide biosynthesis enoyl-CoA isomerase pksi [Paenibacillus polymyxa SQR-21]AIY07722.1 polyketide biosynthesis enoyl-CoA hydratase [Paenibacillus polymyxa]KAE8558830.1 enoyl-CoA hydratase [Paenibacillus polymyxa]KAF6585689.1 enoyl-CoA hydratase/isomerase family protein [Paenibacillus sp. EKM211P]
MSQSVVELLEIERGIIQVTMQDRVHKNTFTLEMTHGLREAFRTIQDDSTCKVVIITGYDNYFATGGTQEGLLAIHEGTSKFTDENIYSLALNCKVPVIAAMQGHAVGGGFVMGLFSDFVILSKESMYTTNFMRYGFTPGMGATFILPQKLGFSLGEELLLNGGNYRGAELEKRGVPFPVLPRKEVMSYGLDLARQLAEKPRFSLITLKDHLVAPLRAQLPKIVEQELIMHEKTFHQAEVKERIINLFGK